MRRLSAALLLLAVACAEPAPPPDGTEDGAVTDTTSAVVACDTAGVRAAVEGLGARLKQVSLTAPDSVVVPALREAYEPYVTAALLAAWTAAPREAPGRAVSSPWPKRIEIRRTAPAGVGACRVEGEVVYVTSVDQAQGGAAAREPVTLTAVHEAGAWRVSAYERVEQTGAEEPEAGATENEGVEGGAADAQAAADVVRRYYEAINAGDYRAAYALWGDGGAESGQTYEAFAEGYAETARVEAEVGTPGRVEGAAGSRYVAVPVTLRAEMDAGAVQRYEGTYTLRRSVVDGATPEQRRWHLYAADLRRADG